MSLWSLRRFLEGLTDHVAAIGSWLFFYDTFDYFLSRTRIETEVNVTVGFCLGLALTMGFPEAMCSPSLVSDSVTHLSTPFTILTQEAVLLCSTLGQFPYS